MRKKNPGAFRALPHIADRLFDRALLIHPRKLRSIVGVLGLEMGIAECLDTDLIEAAEDDFLSSHETASLPAGMGIAVVPIHGTLVQRGDGLDAMSGLRSYDSIRCDLLEALEDPTVNAILLDVDSGGGEVAGCFDLAADIAKWRAQKPIYALANEHSYSAAYALASAAEELYVARTGGVGSIGVVAVHTDQSAFDEKQGFSYTPVYAGAKKVDGWAHGPLSDTARKEFQTFIDRSYKIFTQTVAANRGLSAQAVMETQAGCFIPADALELGLVDGIANLEEVIEIIAARLQDASGGNKNSGQDGRKAISGPAGEHSTHEESNMKKLFGKRQEAETPAEDETKKNAATPPVTDAAKKKAKQDPDLEDAADDDKEQYADDPDQDGDDDENDPDDQDDEDDEDDDKPAKKKNAKSKAAANAAAITDLCNLAGRPHLASGFIRKELSAKAVQRQLLKLRNEDAESALASGEAISTAHSSGKTPQKSLADGMRDLCKSEGLLK